MSSNLLKMSFTNLDLSDKRVIDTNERVAQLIGEQAAKRAGERGPQEPGGFQSGLAAQRLEGILTDPDGEGGSPGSNVIKAEPPEEDLPDPAQIAEDARREAEEILADARQQAEGLVAAARDEAESAREEIIEDARRQGYEDGMSRAEKEIAAKERELSEQRRAMEAEYDALLDSMEPRFVDVITDVYEHLFAVELSPYRDILTHLIGNAIRRIESQSFLVRVSADDYPYVTMEKKTLSEALSSPRATLELVEDNTLKHNECMIETEGGIFDCGLGTQLSELRRKLRLLSYERSSNG